MSARKYKPGDICEVIQNLLSPRCVGHTVRIVEPLEVPQVPGRERTYYKVAILPTSEEEVELEGIAAETCLKKV